MQPVKVPDAVPPGAKPPYVDVQLMNVPDATRDSFVL
jgi:hypothetical protein